MGKQQKKFCCCCGVFKSSGRFYVAPNEFRIHKKEKQDCTKWCSECHTTHATSSSSDDQDVASSQTNGTTFANPFHFNVTTIESASNIGNSYGNVVDISTTNGFSSNAATTSVGSIVSNSAFNTTATSTSNGTDYYGTISQMITSQDFITNSQLPSCTVQVEIQNNQNSTLDITPCSQATSSSNIQSGTSSSLNSSPQNCNNLASTIPNIETITNSSNSNPSFLNWIKPLNYEFSNLTDFNNLTNIENRQFYSIPKSWDVHRHISNYFATSNFECPVVIYDQHYNIVDKCMLYNFLTSKGCEITKDVHQWLQEKLAQEINNKIQTEIVRAQIHDITDKSGHQQIRIQKENVEYSSNTEQLSKKKRKGKNKRRSRKQKTKSKIINIDSAFGLECNNCGGQHIKPRSTRRAIKPLTELTKPNQKAVMTRLTSGISEILELNGQTLESYLDCYFEANPEELYNRVDKFVCKNSCNMVEMYHHLQTIPIPELQDNLSALGAVYFTDKTLMSDTQFEYYRSYHQLRYIICSKDEMRTKRDDLNIEIQELLQITGDRHHIHADIECCLTEVLNLVRAKGGTIPETLEIKSFWDGRPGEEVIHAFTLLNTILSTQCRNNVFLTDMYKGKENTDNIEQYFDTTFSKLDSLVQNKFKYVYEDENKIQQTKLIPVKVFICSDLSALWKLYGFKFVCPYCDCTSESRLEIGNLIEQKLKNYPNLQKNVVIDALHAKLRIVGSLLDMLINKVAKSEIPDIEKKIRETVPGLSQFKFREKKVESGKQSDEKIMLEVPYINGDQADMILLNYEQIFKEALSPNVFNGYDYMIWSLFRDVIYRFLEAPSGILESQDIDVELPKILAKLKDVLRQGYPNEKFGYYIHIILHHLPLLLKNFKSLARYMNQGCESAHALGRMITDCKSNHKMKGELPSFRECLLLPYRLLLMSSKYGREWVGTLQNDNKEISVSWKELLNQFKMESQKILSSTTKEQTEQATNTATSSNINFDIMSKEEQQLFTSALIFGEEKVKENTKQIRKKKIWNNIKSSEVKPKKRNNYKKKAKKLVVKEKAPPKDMTITACDHCKHHHRKCDKAQPQCSECTKHNITCVYSVPKKRGRKQKNSSPPQKKTTTSVSSSSRRNLLNDNYSLIEEQSNPMPQSSFQFNLESIFSERIDNTQTPQASLDKGIADLVFEPLLTNTHLQLPSSNLQGNDMEFLELEDILKDISQPNTSPFCDDEDIWNALDF